MNLLLKQFIKKKKESDAASTQVVIPQTKNLLPSLAKPTKPQSHDEEEDPYQQEIRRRQEVLSN